MSLREWLVLLGGVVIAVVLLDGYRRMRLARKRSSELSFGLEEVKGFDEELSSELPNGGARKLMDGEEPPKPLSNKPELAQRLKKHFRADSGQERVRHVERAERIEPEITGMEFGPESGTEERPAEDSFAPQQTSLNLEETVPVLMNVDELAAQASEKSPAPAAVTERSRKTAAAAAKSREQAAPREAATERREPTRVEKSRAGKKEKLADRPAAAEVLVINVLAKGDSAFDGGRLLQSLLGSGMRFGDMSIFHRYSNRDGSGKILFSMANGVEPGTFDIDNLENTETTAVSFFMGMPGPRQPLEAFSLMEEAARQLVLDLGGELKDEQFSVMTQQTLEHCRQRIRDCERKQLAQKHSG
ncbi:MAG: cell division protein ZipA [Endozoicomonas sp.]